MICWLFGRQGAGKTETGKALKAMYPDFIAVDGDAVRSGLSSDLGYSQYDRMENARRISEIAKILDGQDFNVVVSSIAPTNEIRKMISLIIPNVCMFYLYSSVDRVKNPHHCYFEEPDFDGIDTGHRSALETAALVAKSCIA